MPGLLVRRGAGITRCRTEGCAIIAPSGVYTFSMTSQAPARTSVIVISDFICPWCYIGLAQIERLAEEYDLEVDFAPYLLDPTIPPEGKPRQGQTQPGDPPTDME